MPTPLWEDDEYQRPGVRIRQAIVRWAGEKKPLWVKVVLLVFIMIVFFGLVVGGHWIVAVGTVVAFALLQVHRLAQRRNR